jgi:hypothetical protein
MAAVAVLFVIYFYSQTRPAAPARDVAVLDPARVRIRDNGSGVEDPFDSKTPVSRDRQVVRSGDVAAPPSAAVHLRMRVLSKSTATDIVGAEVFAGRLLLGSTDVGGRCDLPLSALGDSLAVSADGFATAAVQAPPQVQASHADWIVQLESEAVLLGRVLTTKGEIAKGDCFVACWPSTHWPTITSLDDVIAGAQSHKLAIVQTAKDGSFAIHRLHSGVHYKAIAFGCGYLSADGSEFRGTTGESALLHVSAAFGAIVKLVPTYSLADKKAIRIRQQGTSWSGSAGEATAYLPTSAELALWALSCHPEIRRFADRNGRADENEFLLIYEQDQAAPTTAVPAHIYASVPGYEPVSTDVELGWIGNGLAEMDVNLHPTSQCFGPILVRSVAGALDGWSAQASLKLRRVDSGEVYSAPILFPSTSDQTVDGIPCGTYSVTVSANDNAFTWPSPLELPVTVQVARNVVTPSVVINAGPYGGVQLELIDERGDEFTGSFVASLEYGIGSVINSDFELASPPYNMGPVYPRAYRVRIGKITEDIEVLEPSTSVTVTQGSIARVTIPIRRKRG